MRTKQLTILLTLLAVMLLPLFPLKYSIEEAAATEAEQVNNALVQTERILSDAMASYTLAWGAFEELWQRQQDYYDFYNSQERYQHLEFLLIHNDTLLEYLEEDNLQALGESMGALECLYYEMQDAYWYFEYDRILSLYDELLVEYDEFKSRMVKCESTIGHIWTMMMAYEKRLK